MLFCDSEMAETAVWGQLLAAESAGRTRLILSSRFGGRCRIRHEDGREIALADDFSSIVALCRDPVSDRDHTAVLGGGGTSCCEIQIWSVDPVDLVPMLLHQERWGDDVPLSRGRWSLRNLVADDGTCLWRSRLRANETVRAALHELGVGKKVDERRWFGEDVTLTTREIPPATVREWLVTIDGVTIEGIVHLERA